LSESVESWFESGGGAPGFFFKGDPHGKSVRGKIVKMEKRQVLDYVTKKPRFYDDGNPIEQAVLTLQTSLREGPDDDGRRRVFLKNKDKANFKQALEAAGAQRPELGADLTVTYAADAPPTQPGMSPSRVYVFEYVPAAVAGLSTTPTTNVTPSTVNVVNNPPAPTAGLPGDAAALAAALKNLPPEVLKAAGYGG